MLLASNYGGGADNKLYVDDVFSTYLYTGNGSTQTINNGIDLAGKGGLVWIKKRDESLDHCLTDTARGATKTLFSNSTSLENVVPSYLTSFNNNGFSLGNGNYVNSDGALKNYVSWTFRKAPKFFDVVTYTGNKTIRQIAHSLGIEPGMIVFKRTDSTSDWFVWHRGLSAYSKNLKLNTTNAELANTLLDNTAPTATHFTIGNNVNLVNDTGATYVAYLFAHDPSEEGIIQCGSYIGTGADLAVDIGWEPQFILLKAASRTGTWYMFDSMLGMPVGVADNYLRADSADAEGVYEILEPTATGFKLKYNTGDVNESGSTYIYLAVRRPNKPPTSGTEVFAPVIGNNVTSSGIAYSTSFTVDSVWPKERAGQGAYPSSRLTGGTQYLNTSVAGIENTSPDFSYATQTGFYTASTRNESGRVGWCFRRAPGFFDVVCYTGTGVAGTAQRHNLNAAPELYIIKCRNDFQNWFVFHSFGTSIYRRQYLNTTESTGASGDYSYRSGGVYKKPDATNFYLEATNANVSGGTYVAYLFASLPGISKVGSYTGNGSSQTINCGFTTGARFILIKRTDSTGDWYVWDSVRGIVAANDPHLSLNTTAAEVSTDDSVDPDASGFIVNQNTATNINVSGGTYIFLAIS